MNMGRLFTICLLVVMSSPAVVFGHGYLKWPEPRNLVHQDYRYTYPGGDGSGDRDDTAITNRLIAGGFDFFPDVYPAEATHGLCGDPWRSAGITSMPAIADQVMMEPSPYTAWYREGDVIEIEVAMTANHRGNFEIRICEHNLNQSLESQAAGQLCLDEHLLLRVPPDSALRNGECFDNDGNPVSPVTNPDCQPVDENYPGRFYIPADTLLYRDGGHPYMKAKFQLPQGLTCSDTTTGNTCTMQWWWMTANRCVSVGEIDWYAQMHALHPDTANAFTGTTTWTGRECSVQKQGQQFWNCADIVIVPQDAPAPPEPSYFGWAGVSVMNGEGSPTNDNGDPVDTSSPCAARYADCRGTCCKEEGDVCYEKNAYWAQCAPKESGCPEPETPNPGDPWTCEIIWEAWDEGWPDETDPVPVTTPAPEDDTPATTAAADPAPATTAAQDPPAPPATTAEPEPPSPPETTPVADPEPEVTPEDDDGFFIEGCFQAGVLPTYGNCTGQHSGCCADGELCFTLNDDYAQCRAPGTCPDCKWECEVLPEPCQELVPHYGNCRTTHCCEEGLVCYEQDYTYAQCLPPGGCPECNSWSCTELTNGEYAPATRRSLIMASTAAVEETVDAVPVEAAAAVELTGAAMSDSAHELDSELRAAPEPQDGGRARVEAKMGTFEKVSLAGSTLFLAAAAVVVGKARSDLHSAQRHVRGMHGGEYADLLRQE